MGLFEERKETIYNLIQDPIYRPMKAKEIAMLLLIPKEQREELQMVLDSLVHEGRIGLTKKGKYCKLGDSLVAGIFSMARNGYGFVKVNGQEEEIFIAEKNVHGAMQGDEVLVSVIERFRGTKLSEGVIDKVIKRAITEVVGLIRINKKFAFLIPYDKNVKEDIFIPSDSLNGAKDCDMAVAKIVKYPTDSLNAEGEVIEVIGNMEDVGADIVTLIRGYGIPDTFPEEVLEEVKKLPDKVLKEEYANRKDFRSLKTVTIDGEDAKDLDDAISITFEDGIYTLYVHIADVTNYVKEGSALDKEAINRGTSVYLVDRVIPMLPKELSNGICSLNAKVDRLALSVVMQIDEKGKILSSNIYESVINVDERMNYSDVNAIITNKDEKLIERYKDLVNEFQMMAKLSKLLRKNRHERGSIDFDLPECKIILDDKGKPVDIKPYERNDATRLIEDFMLAANESVAEEFFWRELPFVYRIHENPDPDKITELGIFINNFGYSLHVKDGEVYPLQLQQLLGQIEGSEYEALLSKLVLRSLKRARYSTSCDGHFGLAAKYYCHYTSPIRRYPDLQIHRIIKENLSENMSEKRISHYEKILGNIAVVAGVTERRADDVERECDKLKMAEYMQEHVGETFEGIISSVVGWGFYVELANTIEGLVSIDSLMDDDYEFNEKKYELVGRYKNRHFVLGEKVLVKVLRADKVIRKIDFEFVKDVEDVEG